MASMKQRVHRLREWVQWLAERYKPACWVCHQPLTVEDLLKGECKDGLTIHHVDENRQNNVNQNLEMVHRSCHLRWHRTEHMTLMDMTEGERKVCGCGLRLARPGFDKCQACRAKELKVQKLLSLGKKEDR